MKILMLSDAKNSHTLKWANGLSLSGHIIVIFSLQSYDGNEYASKIKIFSPSSSFHHWNKGLLFKSGYIKALPQIKKIVADFKPDIVHAHYISSYGLLGALLNFKPYIVSVWGSDIFLFPKISILHKLAIKFIFKRASSILSTSHAMASEIRKYINREITITPFGIDTNIFRPTEEKEVFNSDEIVIGTIKSLEKIYGIEYLLKAFKILIEKYPNLPLKLLIVGGGSLKDEYEEKARILKISHLTTFTGRVNITEIHKYHNMLSIYVAVSLSESFGVAVLEASACAKPVVVSNVGGLPEVVENNITGFIVPKENEIETAIAIEKLILNPELRKSMGTNGRKKVLEEYDLNQSLQKMLDVYKQFS